MFSNFAPFINTLFVGIADRKQREKEELRELILQGARAVLLRDGFEKVSIRKVANEIEYSPGTIYLYYKDKDELMLALHREAFACKIEVLAPLLQIEDPIERIATMGRTYVAHGLSQPDDYHLMFQAKRPMSALASLNEEWHLGQTGFHMLTQTLQEGIEKKIFRADLPVEGTALMLWSMVHGLTSLHLSERLNIMPEESRDRAVEEVFQQVERILQQCL